MRSSNANRAIRARGRCPPAGHNSHMELTTRLGVGLGGLFMVAGSLLPWGFSDYGGVFGFRYGGPLVSRVSDWAQASSWIGDAWITVVVGTVLLVLALRRHRRMALTIVVAAAGTALAL